MSYLKIAGLGAAALALAGLAWLIIATIDKARQVKGYRACSKAVASTFAPLDDCDATIRPAVEAARSAAACDAALTAQRTDTPSLYAIRATCSEPVKALDAERTAAIANVADAREQLRLERADRDQAISRAEARATTTADRNASNARTIEDAPRTDGGLVRCDAQCLRDLARR